MSHLDEGTLHALLDGELGLHEVREIQAHLGSCKSCGSRLKSVKEVLSESDRLVGAVQFPGTPRRPAGLDLEPEPEPDSDPEPEAVPDPAANEADTVEAPVAAPRPRPRERRPETQPVYDEPPPVLLVPDESNWFERRRRLIVGMRWAALVLVAVGAGYIANEIRQPDAASRFTTIAPGLTDAGPEPVVSAEETNRPDSAAPAEDPPRVAAAPPEPQQRAPEPAPEPTAPAPAAEEVEEEPAPAEAQEEPGDAVARDEAPPPAADVRAEAAEALAELDRQRRRERAAAATAALDAEEARRRAQPSAPAPPPEPPTLQQRSRIYLRIGLDEAARQLGRPVHVIEGMSPQFMGLVRGGQSAGADPTRPVVRVVYQDSQDRMILLDQQRIRPGQSWGTGANRWTQGDIGLYLHGEPGPAVLGNLRPRVR